MADNERKLKPASVALMNGGFEGVSAHSARENLDNKIAAVANLIRDRLQTEADTKPGAAEAIGRVVQSLNVAALLKIVNGEPIRYYLPKGLSREFETVDFPGVAQAYASMLVAGNEYLEDRKSSRSVWTEEIKPGKELGRAQKAILAQVKAPFVPAGEVQEARSVRTEKALSVSDEMQKSREEAARGQWGATSTLRFLGRTAISVTIASLFGTPLLTTLLVSIPLGMLVGAFVNKLRYEHRYQNTFTKIALTAFLMILLGPTAQDYIASAIGDSAWKTFGDFVNGFVEQASTTTKDVLDAVTPSFGDTTGPVGYDAAPAPSVAGGELQYPGATESTQTTATTETVAPTATEAAPAVATEAVTATQNDGITQILKSLAERGAIPEWLQNININSPEAWLEFAKSHGFIDANGNSTLINTGDKFWFDAKGNLWIDPVDGDPTIGINAEGQVQDVLADRIKI